MDGSILDDVKRMIGGLDQDYTPFDRDIILLINTALHNLCQIGIGPQDRPFTIEDNRAKWSDFISDISLLEPVKTYVFIKVKLVFDPPASSTLMQALKETLAEQEWRLYISPTGKLPTSDTFWPED